MIWIYRNSCNGSEIRAEKGHAAALNVAEWLTLAAAPTFAIMALFTGVLGDARTDILCSEHTSPFSGMIPMYWLMSAFHLAPWLRLISRWRTGATQQGLPSTRANEPGRSLNGSSSPDNESRHTCHSHHSTSGD